MSVFYIFTNSPGEVFGWVNPVISRITNEYSNASIHIFLTPCQYATGQESKVCKQFPCVKYVYGPFETIKCLFFQRMTFKKGIVLFLGGNPFYAKYLAKRSQSPLIGYSEYPIHSHSFDYIFYKNDDYDLMLSGLVLSSCQKKSGIVLLPGSRPEHLDVALPFMLDILSYSNNKEAVDVMLSPFISNHQFKYITSKYKDYSFKRLTSVNDLASFKFALTIPGTNTMHLAYFGIPYLMILPTHRSKILRLDGLVGMCLMIPLLGSLLKFLIIRFLERKTSFYSLPNKRLNQLICPELVGRFSPKDAAHALDDLITNDSKYQTRLTLFKTLLPKKNVLDDIMMAISKVIK